MNNDDIEFKIKQELEGVASLSIDDLNSHIIANNIPVSKAQIDEVTRATVVGGIPGKLFRHNGKTIQYFTNTFAAIPFPTMVREDIEFAYDDTSRGISINRSGWYSVRASISVGITSNARQISEYAVFVNGVIQEGSRAFGYHRLYRAGNMTTTVQYLLNVSEGDIIDIRGREFSNRDQRTIANACNIMIERA